MSEAPDTNLKMSEAPDANLKMSEAPDANLKKSDAPDGSFKKSDVIDALVRPAEVPVRGLRVLSLDGGGIRGLSSLLVLQYLMDSIDAKNPPKPCEFFDIIGGTSTGGLIAIMLGRLKMSVSDTIDAYIELSETVFAPKHRLNVVARLWDTAKVKGSCNSAALEKAIKAIVVKAFGSGHENDVFEEEISPCRSFVCAIRANKRSQTGPVLFRSYAAKGADDLRPAIWEVARATSAASLFFDSMAIGKYGETFVDGGGGFNNPVQQALDEAIACWKNRDIQCIISIGTGKSSLKAFGSNIIELGKTLVDIVTEADKTAAIFAHAHPQYPQYDQKGMATVLYRFQVEQGLEDVGMAEHKKIGDIAAATRIYMMDADQVGKKQLNVFGALMAGSSRMSNYVKISSVALEPMIVRYIENYADILQFKSPQLLLPNGKPDYSSGTVCLPARLLCSIEEHRTSLSFCQTPLPIWTWVLSRYRKAATSDNRLKRISVQEATWCNDFGGSFAIEVPVIDVWRIIASYNPFTDNHTNTPNTDTEIHIQNLWIGIPSKLHGQPLLHMMLRPRTAFSKLAGAIVPSEKFATAMCGGPGLPPDGASAGKLYSSTEAGWELIRVPLAFVFTLVPLQNRCFFEEHWNWIRRRALEMLKVCYFLWDHADADDLDENSVPIKIILEEAVSYLDTSLERFVSVSASWRLVSLSTLAENALTKFLKTTNGFIEIEDAVDLLNEAKKYTGSNTAQDENGMNSIVATWSSRFGPDMGRWIALNMTMKLLINMIDAMTFPKDFNALLWSGNGKCFIV